MSGDAIQPHGFLIEVSREWLVEHASANLADFVGTTPEKAFGRPLADLLGSDTVHAIRNQLSLLRASGASAGLRALLGSSGAETFDFTVHADGHRAIIEGERSAPTENSDPIDTVRTLAGRLSGIDNSAVLLTTAARQLRALTGFDRVALYRRHGDAAQLAAESVRNLGSAAPHLSAKEMPGLATGLEIIRDRDAGSVAILPPTRRAFSALVRHPAPGRIDYLRRSGVRSSLALPLTVAGRDWGLIECHHPVPRPVSIQAIAAIGLYAQLLELMIEIRELRAAN